MVERATNMAPAAVGGVGQGPRLKYDIKTDQLIMINHGPDTGIHLLHRAVALDALYDSAERFPQPKCHPETRKELLDNLYDWATDPNSKYSIRWLHGPAGAGKSAVMQTLCGRLRDAQRLGGGFFFKRGHATRGNAKMLFATLAYELALYRSELKDAISRIVETNPSLLGRGMDVQLRNLILEPCKRLQDTIPLILLVDGLDECEDHRVQRDILRLTASTVNDPGVPLRILVASRPEPHIRETFDNEYFQGLFDSVNIYQSFEDVRIYLRHEFLRIHREHPTTMQNIPTPWPSPEILEILVEKSSGYFIYASTVIKFVDDEYSWPSQQLDIITRNLVPHDAESPFEALDQLYIQILSGIPARYRPRLFEILCVIMHYPDSTIPLMEIDNLLALEPGAVLLILRPLHSVLKLSCNQEPIRVHHASFRDFLDSQERSSIFYPGSPQHRAKLGHSILKAVAYRHEDPRKSREDSSFRWCVQIPPFADGRS
ncbi:putative nwd2 protein [Mycena venus]|uniref:Putative nwd2 protein n=1 Tax=Mycena venus TaxID=2733690 RepID=A0A8H6XZ72_9AGAR|nr:putative nwd2 protein [Mycena venus]